MPKKNTQKELNQKSFSITLAPTQKQIDEINAKLAGCAFAQPVYFSFHN